MLSNNSLGSVSVLGTNKPDNLIVGVEKDVMTQDVLLLTTQGILARGSVIGIVTASAKGVITEDGAAHGSEVANLILAETIDTDGGDIVATAYKAGVFNRALIIFGTGGATTTYEQDLDNLREKMRKSCDKGTCNWN